MKQNRAFIKVCYVIVVIQNLTKNRDYKNDIKFNHIG